MARRGRGGQGNKGRGKRNRGPGKNRKKRVSRKRKQPNRRPRKISSKTKKKMKKVNRARQKLNKKIRSKKLSTKVKSVKKAAEKAKKKTISASQSRKQVRQKTKQKIATRKKINMPSLGRIGRTLRNIRQPMSGLSSMAINSVLGRPGIASSIAQAAVNNLGKQNRRTRDMSKLTPQQRRKFERLSEKTGKDYSIRNPSFRINMNMRDIAKFTGLDKNSLYNRLPKSIRTAQVNKQFYSNPTKKGWHSSQRTGRGQGLTDKQRVLAEQISRSSHPEFVHERREAAGLPSLRLPRETRGVPQINDMRYIPDRYKGVERFDPEIHHRDGGYRQRPPERLGKIQRQGPERDWLSSLYTSHNINKGQIDQEARDYWTNEAKTKGRDAASRAIIETSKAQGTYGGRKKPRRITTGPRRSIPKRYQTNYKGATVDSRFAGRTPRNLEGNRPKRRANKAARRKARLQNEAVERQYKSNKKTYNKKKKKMTTSQAAIRRFEQRKQRGIRGGV